MRAFVRALQEKSKSIPWEVTFSMAPSGYLRMVTGIRRGDEFIGRGVEITPDEWEDMFKLFSEAVLDAFLSSCDKVHEFLTTEGGTLPS